MDFLYFIAWIFIVPVIGGSIFSILTTVAVLRYFRSSRAEKAGPEFQPPVTILKPVCGLERGLKERLRTACLQNYDAYQVVYCVQNPADPALPLIREIEAEFGPERVSVVVADIQAGPNGKVNNMLGGLTVARYDVLVISDSDVELAPSYLRTIVAPLADPQVGLVCTPFKACGARRWFEKLELLSYNADFIPSVIFAFQAGAANFCLGPSVAFTRETLNKIGGFEALAEYLAEDYEIGRRVNELGRAMAFPAHMVDVEVDIASPSDWWRHQIYWDQNTRVSNPAGYVGTVFVRAVPFALLYALAMGGEFLGLAVLGAGLAIRLLSAWVTLSFGMRDREGVQSLLWLPVRDCAALFTWAFVLLQQSVTWRGTQYQLVKDGRMVAVEKRA